MSNTPHLGLPLMAAAQAQKHVTHNEALFGLDALVHLAVLDRDLTTPPASPSNGARYIVTGAGVGAWAGKGGQIAVWQDGAWRFHAPGRGWLAYVIDEGALLGWDGAAWTDAIKTIAQFQDLTRLGLGTTADAVNPFSAKLNDALWTARAIAEGGTDDLRYKLNKESAARTLSLLFQDGYSGRAEMGLVGDDDFRIKVSPDGAVWKEALRIDRATGAVAFPAGSSAAGAGKNLVLNGNFAVNQRSYVSSAALAGGAYGHDRWKGGHRRCGIRLCRGQAGHDDHDLGRDPDPGRRGRERGGRLLCPVMGRDGGGARRDQRLPGLGRLCGEPDSCPGSKRWSTHHN